MKYVKYLLNKIKGCKIDTEADNLLREISEYKANKNYILTRYVIKGNDKREQIYHFAKFIKIISLRILSVKHFIKIS